MAEPERQELVSLREYLEHRVHELEKRVEQRSELEAKALDKAEDAMTARLEGMNEIRAQLSMQKAEFVSLDKYDAEVKALRERIESLEATQANMAGRFAMLGLFGAAVVVAVNFAIRVLFGN